MSAADILEDDWDCKREHEREDKSSTQSICIESHSTGNMMRDTDLRNYITSLRIPSYLKANWTQAIGKIAVLLCLTVVVL